MVPSERAYPRAMDGGSEGGAGLGAELARRIDGFRRRCYRAALVGRLARYGALALVVAGTVALAARVGLGLEGWPGWLGFAALLAVPPLAHLAARRAVPSRPAAAAWLDAHGPADGSLVTALERPDPAWAARFAAGAERAPAPPAVSSAAWRGPWPAALVFALVSPLAPVATPAGAPASGVEALLAAAVERAAERLEVLTEEVRLEEGLEAELVDRIQRLREQVAEAGIEAGFEGVDALERDLERAAEEAGAASEQLARAVNEAASASAGDGQRASESLREAAEGLREGPLGQAVDPSLLERLEELAAKAAALAGDDAAPLADPEDLERWLEFMEEWAALDEALREQVEGALERLAEAGLIEPGEMEARRASLDALGDAALEELAEELAERLEDLDLDPELAEQMREALAGLPEAPELSPELTEALEALQAQLEAELAGAEMPSGPDLARLLRDIDPALREELFEAMAALEERRAEALEQALELDPAAFELTEEQLAAIARALEALQQDLADWMASELAGTDDEARRALTQALAEAAAGATPTGADGPLERAAQDALAEALEDLAAFDPAALAEALVQVPPELRRALLEQLADALTEAAQRRAAGEDGAVPAPFDGLSAEQLAALADAAAAIADGPPVPETPPLTEQQVRDAIQALQSMDPSRPGAGVP